MNNYPFRVITTIFALILLVLIGCSQEQSNIQPTATLVLPTKTPIPATPTITPIPATPTATAIPCAPPSTSDTISMTLQIQARSGRDVGEGGIITTPGETISFGSTGELTSQSAGFWKSIGSGKFTALFSDPQGDIFTLIELQGIIQWDEASCLIEGADSFLRVQIESGIWINIVDRQVLQGRLILTDAEGNKYQIHHFNPIFSGVLTRE